jgi:hypothetical protein
MKTTSIYDRTYIANIRDRYVPLIESLCKRIAAVQTANTTLRADIDLATSALAEACKSLQAAPASMVPVAMIEGAQVRCADAHALIADTAVPGELSDAAIDLASDLRCAASLIARKRSNN